ncbi:hypothetical protein AM1_3749 [Acaryochloris marina MBIC11017]|uniref:Uncharacterized protein n=1 Tax=Acaryochloris marina (strain MBIC 11017) TaxID=329726 RepID=B0C5L8_ACAM1|nr:hypothetical protein AM1_3749 [Acaryochloris marina MBIC11017]
MYIALKVIQAVGLPMITITLDLCSGSPAKTADEGRIVQTFKMVPMKI